ncbi:MULTISPECIES: molybdopterin-dependent oxidoreductase [unclassified Caballeronia]|uniref:molybdopterin-dependent oxidoreductase n=1 Tax=unclassified Caballeronia TaxID=2646786 RepID=UPI001F36391B|nr:MULTISPECIES: molybdopterin-dependent oxidoreductase [unclassified Caballeronia]MCE4548172.1 molybdopterin-dependent oxidoreductase [Caballeronia sp. PC1]MCE4575837.1 molybdopterin-dependent oxidoreductase [Caballeronia sp. CLC5]
MPTYTFAHWGTYEVDTRADGAYELRPLPRDPDPSPIGVHLLDDTLEALRVRRPAVRESWLKSGPGARPDLRGQEPFVEIEWDHALDLVATEIQRVRGAHGNASIFGGSYGWSSAGRFHHAQSQVHRFLNAAGGYVRHVDSYSLGAANVILPHVVAPMDDLMASHSSWDTLAEHTDLFVSFGGVPIKNAQMNAGGVGIHGVPTGLARMQAGGAHFVNIGPVRDNFGALSGEAQWIACRPNTDAAVMLALAWTLLTEELYDRAFLSRYCVGFDVFASYLIGESDGQAKTPGWAEAISGVSASSIVALARRMAASRTMLNVAWSLQRAVHGEQPFWMVVVLAAMLGQIGQPGGGFGVGYGAANLPGSAHVKTRGPTLPQGKNAVSDFIPVARFADMLLHPGEPFTYNGDTYTYPDIRLVYWAGGNPFHHHQDLNRMLRAWRKPETIVIHEQYWTPSAKRADIVLPATISLERDDIGMATREAFFIAMKKVRAPTGASRDDYDIFAALAHRLGCGELFTESLNARGWLRRMYDRSQVLNRNRGIELPDFDLFWQAGMVDLSEHDHPITMLADFVMDPDKFPLNTASGKIEIYSERVAGFRLADCPGHPVWLAPPEWLGAPAAQTFPLHLLTDQPARRLHSQLDASPYSQAGKINGREAIYLNPADAETRGIADGQLVEVFNERGRCLAGARLSRDVMPGVARLNTGAWFDPDVDTGLDKHGNPNVLTLDRPASGLSQGCSAQTCLVDVRPWRAFVPPITAFTLPEFVS